MTHNTKYAHLVGDNAEGYVHAPLEMGSPRHDQLEGTPLERLAEVAGRVCYDSLGTGRSSIDWHKHVLEVGHLSVYEHCVFTVTMPFQNSGFFVHIINRPGTYVQWSHGKLRLTLNLRTVLDWDRMSAYLSGPMLSPATAQFGRLLRHIARPLAPMIVQPETLQPHDMALAHSMRVDAPQHEHEHWATVWMRGSRRFSHELVRHGDWTAISQRSTRYVNENGSLMSPHPYNRALFKGDANDEIIGLQAAAVTAGRDAYDATFEHHVARGASKKQARAAAADWLPHALETQVVFSASLAQWRHIKLMRVSEHADAHIREIITQACEEVGV